MALKSSREGLRKELVDYLGNLIIDENLKQNIINSVDDVFINNEELSISVNELDEKIRNESSARENADNTLQNNINIESTTRQEAINSIEDLINNGVLKVDLLWTNASSTSGFEPHTISLDFRGYKQIMIEIKAVSSSGLYSNVPTQVFIFENNPQVLRINMTHTYICSRQISILSNGITFSDGEYIDSYNQPNLVKNNSCVVPTKIWGVK